MILPRFYSSWITGLTVCRFLPDAKAPERAKELDERLLSSPALALARCSQVLYFMAGTAVTALKDSLENIIHYEEKRAENISRAEYETDHLKDVMGTYLLKLTSRNLSEEESARATEYMKLIGDYERIADHAVNIVESSIKCIWRSIAAKCVLRKPETKHIFKSHP